VSLGRFHRVTLNLRRGVAYWLAKAGELEVSAQISLQLFHDCLDNLDESEWVTYAAMMNYASCFAATSSSQDIVDFYDDFDFWMRNRQAPAQAIMTLRYERARALQAAGLLDDALAIFRSILSDEVRARGRLNSITLNAYCELFKCLAAKGELDCAIDCGKKLLEECQAVAHSMSINTQYLRLTIAMMIGEAGDVAEAIRLVTELREERKRQYGEDQPEVRAMDDRLRYWAAVGLADGGFLARSADELRQLSEDLMISSGINSELRKRVLGSLGRITAKLWAG
jgi:tetratricopeptide (TPR) repeat protein